MFVSECCHAPMVQPINSPHIVCSKCGERSDFRQVKDEEVIDESRHNDVQ